MKDLILALICFGIVTILNTWMLIRMLYNTSLIMKAHTAHIDLFMQFLESIKFSTPKPESFPLDAMAGDTFVKDNAKYIYDGDKWVVMKNQSKS